MTGSTRVFLVLPFHLFKEGAMGLTRSPEISESVEKNQDRIERSLDFLRKILREEERMTLQIIVTKDAVVLDEAISIEIGCCELI